MNPYILRVLAVYTPEILSVLQVLRLPPSISGLFQFPLVRLSVKLFAILWGCNHQAHRWSQYTLYSEYTAQTGTPSTRSTYGRNIARTWQYDLLNTWKYSSSPQYSTTEYCEVVSAVQDIEYCESPQYSAVHEARILRVPEAVLSEILYSCVS